MEAPAAIEDEPSSASLKARVTTPSGTLNLRSYASSGAAVMLTIPQNAMIPILEKGSEWCKTTYNGKSGYVMTAFLTFFENEAPAATPMPAEEMVPDGSLARVATPSGSLNLRAAMNSGARILGTIPQNTVITVLEKGASWCKTVYNGQTGYVMAKFLAYLNEAEASSSTAPPETVQNVPYGEAIARVTTPSGSLNLRFSASDTARVLCTIPQNTQIQILERGNLWCKVTYNGETGYVMTKFLTFTQTALETAALQEEMHAQDGSGLAWVATESGSLNLRKAAHDKAVVLSTIPQFAAVTLLQKGSNWSQVVYAGTTGYVMTKFLSFTPVSHVETPTATPSTANTPLTVDENAWIGQVTTTSGSLNLRRAANDHAGILCTIPQQDLVLILQRGSNWCHVVYEGKTGYVMTKFLTVIQPAANAKEEADPSFLSEPLTAYVSDAASTLNLRAGPSTETAILIEIPRGANVLVLQEDTAWCQVRYQGNTGYCAREYLVIEK